MPAAHIRVIATPNGGGFGGKSDPFNHEMVVSKAALMLDRPVKICLTREEVFYCHRGRHPVLMQFKTGVKRDGTITGMHVRTLLDGGAYGSYGVASTFYTGALQTVTYHIPTYHFRGLPRLHQQAAVRPEARPRHAAEPLRPGDSARQDRREARDRSRRAAPPHRRAARDADGQLPARRHDRPRRVHPPRDARRRLGRTRTGKLPARARRRPRLLVVSFRRRAADLLERHAALRRAAEARSQRRRRRRSAARPRSARDPTMCWSDAWRKCSASSRSTSARSPATPI